MKFATKKVLLPLTNWQNVHTNRRASIKMQSHVDETAHRCLNFNKSTEMKNADPIYFSRCCSCCRNCSLFFNLFQWLMVIKLLKQWNKQIFNCSCELAFHQNYCTWIIYSQLWLGLNNKWFEVFSFSFDCKLQRAQIKPTAQNLLWKMIYSGRTTYQCHETVTFHCRVSVLSK